MVNTTFQTGYYGKLPLRGDFIQHYLSQEFVALWDGWLQRVISKSKFHLDDQWLEYYLVSPIWRYIIVRKSGQAYAGVLLPSVDKVGRYFPFTIATSPFDSLSAIAFVLQNPSWFKASESLALEALDEQINQDQLNLAIESLIPTLGSLNSPQTKLDSGFRMTLSSPKTVESAIAHMCYFLPMTQQDDYSFWWTDENENSPGHFLCCKGLPDEDLFTAMLDGEWARSDLMNIDSLETEPTSTVETF